MTQDPGMLDVRRSADRGSTRTSWLDSRHSFSFGGYRDPAHMGLRALRVLNEDRIAPASGFGAHPHHSMEILTWLLDGELEHRDSRGSHGVLVPGTAQLMSAGRGIVHSEANPSPDHETHLLQIWLLPDRPGGTPGYREGSIELEPGSLRPVATPDGRDGSLRVRQDASVSALRLAAGDELVQPRSPTRHGWVQVARGDARANGVTLEAGDGAALRGERELVLRSRGGCELLLFDLA